MGLYVAEEELDAELSTAAADNFLMVLFTMWNIFSTFTSCFVRRVAVQMFYSQ